MVKYSGALHLKLDFISPVYKYFATLWLYLTSVDSINKGAEHRNLCRNPEKISY
jgi:hypothetical protein